MRTSYFYIDRFAGINYPYTILLLLVLIISADLFASLLLGLQFIPAKIIDVVAYVIRLSTIIFSFSALRAIYYKLGQTLDDLITRFRERTEVRESLIFLKNEISLLNSPVEHLAAGILANVIYLILLFSYVFPVLEFRPYHVISNAFWVGLLGVGLYTAIICIRFASKFLNILRSHHIVDFYHEDGMGGLSKVSRLSTEVVVLSAIAAGLWVGSIPYAFKYGFLIGILCFGLVIELSMLGYVFHQLHLTLGNIKNVKIQEYSIIFSKAKAIHDMPLPLEEKVNFLIELFLTELALMQAHRLRSPVNYKTILDGFSILVSILPVILQYALYILT